MPNAKPKKFTSTHYSILKRRGLSPKNYILLKETYSSLYCVTSGTDP